LSSLLKCFGFIVINYKIWGSKTVAGVSFKTIQLYVVVFIMRISSIFRHQGYLPFDKTGDWLYHGVEVISLIGIILIAYAIFGPLISTYDEKYDKFGNLHVPNELGAVYVLVPAILVAIFFHP
jgi:ER lumen protein retaining receptor